KQTNLPIPAVTAASPSLAKPARRVRDFGPSQHRAGRSYFLLRGRHQHALRSVPHRGEQKAEVRAFTVLLRKETDPYCGVPQPLRHLALCRNDSVLAPV